MSCFRRETNWKEWRRIWLHVPMNTRWSKRTCTKWEEEWNTI
jgi:hypothetical protein